MSASDIEEIWKILRATQKIVKETAERDEQEVKRRAEWEEAEVKRRAERDKAEAKRRAERDEAEAKRKEEDAKWWAEWKQGMAELRAAQKETDRELKDLKIQVSGVSDNVGYSAEEYFQTALAKDLKFAGIQFKEMLPNLQKKQHGQSCEFDIVLVNHTAVGIIEAKHRVTKNFPKDMATRKAAEFRLFFPEYKNHKLYLGAAGFSINKAAIDEAKKYGVGLLKQDGDAVKAVDIPLIAY